MRTIVEAGQDGVCVVCGLKINEGDEIVTVEGGEWAHADCVLGEADAREEYEDLPL